MIAGSLTYNTELDTKGFQKGINDVTSKTKSAGSSIKSIIAGLGITQLISKAFSMISSNIDSAVSRLDTLNNFPKVMSNLGIGAEESSEAIQTLNKNLEGLPTTLNEGAMAVQRFTSKNGNVKKSVELFTAVNNAILAGGASADIQSTALEQLSQAYAKGKPDMMEWRSLMTAMPAQLKQVAQAMGYVSTDELGEELRNGKVSMDDFMETIITLNKSGTGQFKSFEEQAKNSIGGIGTSVKNMKTAVVRGVASIVQSIDEGLKGAGFGGISKIVTDLGKVVEKVLKSIGKGIQAIIPIIKKVYDWIIKNQKLLLRLAEVVLIVVSAVKIYNALLLITKAINIASSIASTVSAFLKLIPAVTSAKDAMILFNMVTNLNPYAVATTAILGLVTAIGLLIAKSNSFDGLKQKIQDQKKSWEELKKAREDSLEANTTNISILQAEADELQKITDENGKVKKGYENRAQYILNELNNALGTEYSMNNGIISQYQDLKNNIDQLIAKKKAEAILDAYKGEYAEAMKKKAEAVQTLTDLYQQLNDKQNEVAKTSYDQSQKEMDLKKIGKLIKDQTELVGEYGYTIQNYENLTSASVSNNKDEIDKALQQIGVSYDNAKTKTNESLTQQIKDQNNYNNLLNQSYNDAISNHNSYQQTLINEQMTASQNRLNELAKSLAEETSTVNGLTDEQKEAWKTLANNNVTAYAEGLSSLDENTKKEIEEATGITVQEQTLPNGIKGLAKKATDGYSLGLDLSGQTTVKMGEAKDEMLRSNSILDGATKLADDEREGLSTFDAVTEGSDMTKNYASGMKAPSATSVLKSAASGIAGIVSSFLHFSEPDVGPLSDFHTYMPDMIDNMVKGIYSNQYKVEKATNSLAQGIKDQMQNAVNIETGKMNANANIKASSLFNNTIVLNAKFEGNVEMDKRKTGQILAPEITKTIKVGGLM